MKPRNDIETVLTILNNMAQTAKKAARQASALDTKVDMHRLAQKLETLRRDLRMEIFTMEDALELAKTARYCETCQHII